jgi:protein subunit release factor A
MEKIKIEIRSAEGGSDAKLLMKDLANIYKKFCSRRFL